MQFVKCDVLHRISESCLHTIIRHIHPSNIDREVEELFLDVVRIRSGSDVWNCDSPRAEIPQWKFLEGAVNHATWDFVLYRIGRLKYT